MGESDSGERETPKKKKLVSQYFFYFRICYIQTGRWGKLLMREGEARLFVITYVAFRNINRAKPNQTNQRQTNDGTTKKLGVDKNVKVQRVSVGYYDDEVVERGLKSKGERRLKNNRDFRGEHSTKKAMNNNRRRIKQRRINVPPCSHVFSKNDLTYFTSEMRMQSSRTRQSEDRRTETVA